MLLSNTNSSVKNLADASIINYDPDTKTITPNTEAHIMTKHIVSFKTMVLLMDLPSLCTLDQVFSVN